MPRSTSLAVFTFASCLFMAGPALSQSDYYIRSQYSSGGFTGSHEILTFPEKGYHEARYCERTFWVTSDTVLWTEKQVEIGRKLVLEENWGDNRKVICDDNGSFAKLEDLGLARQEVDDMREKQLVGAPRPSRIRIIRDAFKQFK